MPPLGNGDLGGLVSMVARAKYGYSAEFLESEAHALAVLAPAVWTRTSARPSLPYAPRRGSLLRYEMFDWMEWTVDNAGESDESSDGYSTTCDRLSIDGGSASSAEDSGGGGGSDCDGGEGASGANKRETGRRTRGEGNSGSDSGLGNSDKDACHPAMGEGNLTLPPLLGRDHPKDESHLPNGVLARYRSCCGRGGGHWPDCRIGHCSGISSGSDGHAHDVPRPSLPAAVSPPPAHATCE